jgi:hypothetical protein
MPSGTVATSGASGSFDLLIAHEISHTLNAVGPRDRASHHQ